MLWGYALGMGCGFFVLYYAANPYARWRKEMAQVLNTETRPTPARRSAFEIRMDILKVAAAGSAKPTHIMYRSNTSWIVLQKNLESLVSAGLIRQTEDGPRAEYSITQRGREILRDYANLVDRANAEPPEVRTW
jgi:predicted transcriptional regulator